ncbi:MAG TPA: tyrosine-protein phosphatase [Candidatus Dormibacteraeota bacterium]|nr:tyrosine-protein phosphatase [Candidatus Dormibacteraeota bacterium]
MIRRLAWPDCQNTRDLGGLPLPVGGVTRMGVLVRSDSIVHLTPVGREAMVAYGVTTVIDLRTDAEVLSAPNPCADNAGPAYRHLPLIDDSTMLGLGEASGMFERYVWVLDGRTAAFRAIFESVAQADGGVVFHCFAGKDRTGMVAAMVLSLAGVPNDAIAADFAESDAQLALRYQEWIVAAAPEQRSEMREALRCPPDRILGVLDHLQKRWGGVHGYMEAAGMNPTAIERLSAKLA